MVNFNPVDQGYDCQVTIRESDPLNTNSSVLPVDDKQEH